MFENAVWIGLENCEIAPWKNARITGGELEQMMGRFEIESGSIVFRKEFKLDEGVKSAKLAICGLGYYDVYVNGKRPDEDMILCPIYSDYFRVCRYDVYDVAKLLCRGENVIAVEVCGGWFAPPEKWWGWRKMWHGNPRMIAELSMEEEKGSNYVISSDETWKTTRGAVVENCIYDGEKVDFNRLSPNWNRIGYDVSSWSYAQKAEAPTDNLQENTYPYVKIQSIEQPRRVIKLNDRQYVYDFGENGSAVPRVAVKGKKGDTVQLEFSEFLFEDGTLNKESENRALNIDRYILSGKGVEVCQPRFTWHGYRYCMITLSSPEIEILKVEKCVIYSDVATTGTFKCSNHKLNLLHEAYVRTELACLIGVPLDCNQRDERLPWLGDAHVTSEFCLYNFDMRDLYAAFLEDMRIGRSHERKKIDYITPRHEFEEGGTSIDWNLAYPIILMESYERYGDIQLLKAHYETLKEHTDSYVAEAENGMIPACWFGDWFSVDMPEGMEKVVFCAGPEGHRQNPPFAASMFFCKLLRLTAETAQLLGYSEDSAYYMALREKTVSELLRRYYDPESGIFGSGGQFLLTYVLAERIIPETDREKVFANLVAALEVENWHMLMGVIGTRLIFDVLMDFGREDIAYKLLTAEGYPGPLHMIDKERTTLPEGLDGSGSGCHCMFASPDTALYRIFGGITINRRKEHMITIRPYCPEDLDFISCSQRIEEGEVSVIWNRIEDKIVFEVMIPQDCTADVRLSNGSKKKEMVLGAGKHSIIL